MCERYEIQTASEEKREFPAPWPVAAIALRQLNRFTPLSDAVLCFAAGPKLTSVNSGQAFPHFLRFATECRSANLRGQWVPLSVREYPFFVVAYDCGGTAGDYIEVYQHDVAYDEPLARDSYQGHRFSRVYSANSRIPPYLAELDDIGGIVVLHGSDNTNGSAFDEKRATYVIAKWDEKERTLRPVGLIPFTDLGGRVKKLRRI